MIQISQNVYLPAGGRKYTDPLTGVAVVGDTSDAIVAKVLKERTRRGLSNAGAKSEVEEWLCAKFPHICSRKAEKGVIKQGFGASDVKAFLAAVAGTLTSGGVVDQATAETRAATCLTCPYNQQIGQCDVCTGVASRVFKLIGAKRVKNMGGLKGCQICGCSLKAKIWVPKTVLDTTAQIQNNADKFPAWCWAK